MWLSSTMCVKKFSKTFFPIISMHSYYNTSMYLQFMLTAMSAHPKNWYLQLKCHNSMFCAICIAS